MLKQAKMMVLMRLGAYYDELAECNLNACKMLEEQARKDENLLHSDEWRIRYVKEAVKGKERWLTADKYYKKVQKLKESL